MKMGRLILSIYDQARDESEPEGSREEAEIDEEDQLLLNGFYFIHTHNAVSHQV
jgi:hypothetical protein